MSLLFQKCESLRLCESRLQPTFCRHLTEDTALSTNIFHKSNVLVEICSSDCSNSDAMQLTVVCSRDLSEGKAVLLFTNWTMFVSLSANIGVVIDKLANLNYDSCYIVPNFMHRSPIDFSW